MAELAAKIRARFKRRPSAIPSLLSSRSTGSHTSSSHRSHNADHHPDSKSRAGSSRVSVILDLDDEGSTGSPTQPACTGPGTAGGLPGLGLGVGEGEGEGAGQGAEGQSGEAEVESKGDEGRLAGDAPQPPPPDQHEHHQSEPDTTGPISPAQHDSSAGHQAQNAPIAQHASSSSTSPTRAPALDEASSGSVLAGSPEPPAPAVESDTGSEQPAAPASASAPEPEAAPAPAPAPELSSSEGPTATAPASVMPGNDLHPSPRKLSCISEHPSPGHQELLPIPDPITAHPQLAPITKPAASADPTSVLAPKQDDAGDKSAAAAASAAPPPPRTPKLAPAATQRPFHIPLPTAAIVPPSAANLSPNAAYSPKGTVTPSSPLARNSSVGSRPTAPVRRQSLLSNRQSTLIQTLLRGSQADESASISNEQLLPISGNMVMRKIWVKRPGASATLVTINEDDLVDDVREMILRKYANSLGRQFDAPDLTLRIRPNGNQQERMLGPEEPMSRTLDAYFPSGQTVDDALIIDVPLRRTPRASPRTGPPHAPHVQYYVEEARPSEAGNDYFGPGAISTLPVTVTAPSNGSAPQHAISILQTGHPPQIPSPGGTRARTYRERPERPRLGRQHTSSPTLINMASGTTHQAPISTAAGAPHGMQHIIHSRPAPRSRTHSNASDQSQAAPAAPAIPTPPAPEGTAASQRSATPPPRVSSPRPKASKKKKAAEHPSLPKGMLNGSVPPINVLIVEDNIINLKLLEAFVKRLKVRWSTAMNGRDAVTKWRGGGFHLVLMDIQLPVMSGLDATREIRRLERVNSIGVFSSAADAPPEVKGEPDEKDKLENMDLFKSPVIIVALTASSLQSDRHEALAAGCNDFLTKVGQSPPPSLCHRLLRWASMVLISCLLTYMTRAYSPSTLSGSSARLWNGVACRHSSTLTDGASGRTFLPSWKRTRDRPPPWRRRRPRSRGTGRV